MHELRPPYFEIIDQVRCSRHLLLILDFDGTLSPTVEDPSLAILPQAARQWLDNAAHSPRITTAIISGRSIEDLKNRVRLPDIVYGGNFGSQISGGGLRFIDPLTLIVEPVLKRLYTDLSLRLRKIDKVMLEFKRFTLAVHTRQATPQHVEAVGRVIRQVIGQYPQFECRGGPPCYNIIPRTNWNKGKAVEWVRKELGLEDALLVYIGDDEFDEQAFAMLPDAITIKVGEPPTSARYTVSSPAQVWVLLAVLSGVSETAAILPSQTEHHHQRQAVS